VICRDCSGAYADGARVGAQDAVQVADRFDLWQNLGKAVERCVASHRACLRPADPASVEQDTSPEQAQPPEAEPIGRFAERARRHHALVHDLLAQGHGIRTIARRLGWGRHTVQRYARAATSQELVDGKWRQPRPSKLDPFKPPLQQRFQQGCTNASQLHREITALGFAGSYALVRDYLDQFRVRGPSEPVAPAPPTGRRATGWLTRHPTTLSEDDTLQLKAILEQCPELRAAAGHVRAFGGMLTHLTGQGLPG
jgi:transposase